MSDDITPEQVREGARDLTVGRWLSPEWFQRLASQLERQQARIAELEKALALETALRNRAADEHVVREAELQAKIKRLQDEAGVRAETMRLSAKGYEKVLSQRERLQARLKQAIAARDAAQAALATNSERVQAAFLAGYMTAWTGDPEGAWHAYQTRQAALAQTAGKGE